MKPLSKYIFWCFLAGISMNMIKLYFLQLDMATAEEGVYPWYYRVDFLGDVLMCMGSVASFFTFHRYFPSFVRNCYLLLIAFVTFASLEAIPEINKQPTLFFNLKGIGTYINIGILFFAADTKYFPKLLNFFYYLCFFILAACIINVGKVGMGATRNEFLLFVRDYVVFLMWVFPYFFMQDYPNARKNLVNLAVFALIFVVVLSSGSRSYLVLYLLYVIYKFKAQLSQKNVLLIIGAALVIGVGAYYALMSSSLSGTIENALDNLSERKADDSRSDQLRDFFAQYDTDYLIQGVGPLEKWFWHSINDFYSFLDNQIILIAWWAGLPAALTYVYFLIGLMRSESEILYFEDIKGLKVIIVAWLAACLGFAIYCTVCSEHYYYFLSLLFGMTVCRYTEIIDPETETTADEEDAD